jgi:hypothetical protein
MKNVVDVLVFEPAGHDGSRVYQRSFHHLFRVVQIRLLWCGGISHGLGGTNKLLACHETMSSIGIIFIDVVVGRSWLVGGRSMSQCCFLQGFESDSRIFARFTNYSTVVASSRKPSGVVVSN